MMAAEVQLQVMRSFATESNPEVMSLKRRVDEMKRQLAQMQYGDGLERRGARQEIYVPFAKVPEVGLELARQTRELKIQETLVTLLAQQLEQAKIAEAKDIPNVQVLDRAVPAERHFKPRIRMSMLIAGVISLFAGVFVALTLEHVRGASARRKRS
jgi:capsule polysaccharide export protein KpsE/RkpR